MEGRNKHGQFVKGIGSRIFSSSTGHKSGRKKSIPNQLEEIAQDAMPDIFRAMAEKAKDGDVRAAEFLRDTVYGKPRLGISIGGEEGAPVLIVGVRVRDT